MNRPNSASTWPIVMPLSSPPAVSWILYGELWRWPSSSACGSLRDSGSGRSGVVTVRRDELVEAQRQGRSCRRHLHMGDRGFRNEERQARRDRPQLCANEDLARQRLGLLGRRRVARVGRRRPEEDVAAALFLRRRFGGGRRCAGGARRARLRLPAERGRQIGHAVLVPPQRRRPPMDARMPCGRPGHDGHARPGGAPKCATCCRQFATSAPAAAASARICCGRKVDQLGERVEQDDHQHHQQEERERGAGDRADLALGHPLQDEQVEADRRRDLRHLDDDDDEDAEPERVDAGLLHRRHDHAHRQHDHRDAVEEAAEDDVERGQREDQRELAQAAASRSTRRGGAAGRCSPCSA